MDEEKRIVYGPVLIPDEKIIRHNGDYKYFITFSADTIRAAQLNFSKKGLYNVVDEEHSFAPQPGIFMIESFLIDRTAGIAPTEWPDLPDSTWMAKYKVENDDIWAKIKDGTFRGFSIAGRFNFSPAEAETEMSREAEKGPETLDDIIKYIII